MLATPSRPSLDSLTLPAIRAVRLTVSTRWSRPTSIPGAVIANVLRGALGLTLRKLVCPEEWMNHHCPDCELYRSCTYGSLFMPSPPEGSQVMRLVQDLPRPFVIEPPGLDPDERVTPDGLTFRLMLFGTAIDHLPYFISTLDRLGRDGMGKDRVPFTVERITASHPAGDETLYTAGSNTVSLPKQVLTTADLLATPWPVETLTTSPAHSQVRRRILSQMGVPAADSAIPPADPTRPRLKLQFLTPLLLKSGSGLNPDGTRIPAREVRDRPPFGVIIRRLRDRLSSLSTFFGEGWSCPDFAAWGTLADEVTIVQSRTQWLTRQRHSTRTGHAHELSGLIGNTVYEFPDQATFDALTPLVKLGEVIHVGKHALWGNGAMRGGEVDIGSCQ